VKASNVVGTRLPAHIAMLEAESIEIIREVRAQCANPVLLYSIGKDSSVLLHLALKALGRLSFPLLHIDTTWKFADMIRFRDETARRFGLDLIVHTNHEGLEQGYHPINSPSGLYTQVMKTQALRQALDAGGFDAALGGARRDEEKSRAKERVFSFRDEHHSWDPRRQRPEFWNLYNAQVRPGQSMRVFPLSNWTELDVWTYIAAEEIPILDLYFARERPIVERDGSLIMVDDERLELRPGEVPRLQQVRFRTLGCYPLSGAIRSDAGDLEAVIAEIGASTVSERQGRLIDREEPAAMERKKREGYF
jgi:sulfate adenylyltransferase subunit 2